ncbi:hypothetical protein J437_LFUL001138 [Ladona fulva]|uniref:Uncharacterized protein n=1 Tax=Ladona fulva TaxID=123851 RepID=A0A8K0NW21_LADFU|nr:hypothetical protein J437_LFUL001138 [Ladona fulva]
MNELEGNDRIPSLVDLAAQVIVSHRSLTESIITSYRLPPNVMYSLMKVSFLKDLREVIRWKVLCGNDAKDFVDSVRSYFTIAMRSFFLLYHSERKPAKFTLDISGVELLEVQILASLQYLKNLTSARKHSVKRNKKNVEAVGPYTLYMDCKISEININLINLIHDLLKPFKNSLIVEFKRLEIVSVPWNKVLRILHSLNEKIVTSLSINMNGPAGEHFILALKRIAAFKNLTSLSLGQNHIRLSNKIAEILGVILQKCKSITRLNLSGNPVAGSLETILSKKELGLHHLNLSYCSLSPLDVRFLSNSLHRETLIELDLAYNDLNKSFPEFLALIDGASSQLEILHMNNAYLNSHHVQDLVTALSKLKRLRYLNMSQTSFTYEEVMESAKLGAIKSLEVFRPCSNLDDYYFENANEVFMIRLNFAKEFYKYRFLRHKTSKVKYTNILI